MQQYCILNLKYNKQDSNIGILWTYFTKMLRLLVRRLRIWHMLFYVNRAGHELTHSLKTGHGAIYSPRQKHSDAYVGFRPYIMQDKINVMTHSGKTKQSFVVRKKECSYSV